MGHHDPDHVKKDLADIKSLGCEDIFLAAQENDFIYFKGKVEFFAKLAKDYGLNPVAIFWGALNLFGGGRSSQFLLEYPQAYQIKKTGQMASAGCYNNPSSRGYIKQMIDCIAALGFAGYFIDEPTLTECYCPSCAGMFEKMFSGSLWKADAVLINQFRKRCVIDYVQEISGYIKKNYPRVQTLCCLMPSDECLWEDISAMDCLDELGTDIYWVNEDIDVELMSAMINKLSSLCKSAGKRHHQWLQAWGVKKGRENRIKEQGEVFLKNNPDALYVWAYKGQIGTSETCEDPKAAWNAACEILKKAKQL